LFLGLKPKTGFLQNGSPRHSAIGLRTYLYNGAVMSNRGNFPFSWEKFGFLGKKGKKGIRGKIWEFAKSHKEIFEEVKSAKKCILT